MADLGVDPRFGTEDDPRWTTCQCRRPQPAWIERGRGAPRAWCGDCFYPIDPQWRGGVPWAVTISHEMLEMLAGPLINRKQDWSPRPIGASRRDLAEK